MKKLVDNKEVDLTSEEITEYNAKNTAWDNESFNRAIEELRNKRNNLLAKTDWTASSDLTMSDEMKTYRQELRDATNGLDTVDKVNAYEFPTEVLK
jgi:hypothetical protein